MNTLPAELIHSLQNLNGFDEEAFKQVHQSGAQITSIRLNPAKFKIHNSKFKISPVPWTEYGYYLETRPSFTFDPLFHAGCYYVQEASSMFLEQALKQTVKLSKPLKVLDLCAAPGGKSTHFQSLISKDSLLVSNEVIRSRANILKDNIIKWGCQNVMITNNDPKDFTKLEGYFDVIVIDAPCSGSGLFRREPEAIEEWSENNVQLCCQRQQRILADVWPALKENGILIYSTCSYSKEEDEDIISWIMKEFKVKSLKLGVKSEWGITEVEVSGNAFGYRFWPDKVKGEGFFLSCFQKREETNEVVIKTKNKPDVVSKKELEIIGEWVDITGLQFIKNKNTIYAWPQVLANDFGFLLNQLRVVYSGTIAGELIRDKLIPDHALAMSPLVSNSVKKTELDLEDAIQYLKRKDIKAEMNQKGWQMVNYEGHPLGWVNVLSNRINNYYPQELRILKDN